MDRLGLRTLRAEMLAGGRIMQDASATARERFALQTVSGYEGCGYHLLRLYHAFEQAGLRLVKAFENNIDDDRGWHTTLPTLLNRLCLAIEGVRPALLSQQHKRPLTELHGFRHVFVHAYDLQLNPQKLQPLVEHAERAAMLFPGLVEAFIAAVEKQLPQPPSSPGS